MLKTSLDQTLADDPQLRSQLDAGQAAPALETANRRLSASFSDLGLAYAANGKLPEAIKALQDGFNACPTSQSAFHNLLHVLLKHRQLRDTNYKSLLDFFNRNNGQIPWLIEYLPVLVMPTFLNLEFVAGKCNLRCRMCQGSRAHTPESKLVALSPAMFRKILEVAPTLEGCTLSSGDADPLLHPDFSEILDIAREKRSGLDLFTNGQALTTALSRKLVDSQAVRMINFSIDAATPETYRRIRGGDFLRLLKRIEILAKMRQDSGRPLPWLSFSFVAMADNIAELPQFVELAQQLGATRVFVEDLMGWPADSTENRPALDHPQCRQIVSAAAQKAADLKIEFVAPKMLLSSAAPSPSAPSAHPGDAVLAPPLTGQAAAALPHCGWVYGMWVNMDGSYNPCCMLGKVVDMGTVEDGPLYNNAKFSTVKKLLVEGKVFKQCCSQGNCVYVQQQKGKGHPLRIITRDELGELYRETPA